MEKHWKTIQKPVFFKMILWFFKVYSVRTSMLTSKTQKSYSVDNFWFLDTCGTPWSNSPVKILILIISYLKLNSVLRYIFTKKSQCGMKFVQKLLRRHGYTASQLMAVIILMMFILPLKMCPPHSLTLPGQPTAAYIKSF